MLPILWDRKSMTFQRAGYTLTDKSHWFKMDKYRKLNTYVRLKITLIGWQYGAVFTMVNHHLLSLNSFLRW